MDVSKDYYSILGVSINATKKDVRSSYLKLAKKWHPDLHQDQKDKDTARKKFIEVQEAYEVLHNVGMRKKYDEMRRYGYTQQQYKQHEAFNRGSQTPNQYSQSSRPQGGSPFQTAWEQAYRQQMHNEFERIRREQQEWSSSRRQERHEQHQEFNFHGHQNPFNAWQGGSMQPPGMGGGGFLRGILVFFGFFMCLRTLGFMLFGPRDNGDSGRGGAGRLDPFSGRPLETRNSRYPPPPPRAENRLRRDNRDYDKEEQEAIERYTNRRRRLKRYQPPPPATAEPRPSEEESRYRVDDRAELRENEIKFGQSGGGAPQENREVKREPRKPRSRYEKMIQEQKMMEDLYAKATAKDQADYERQQQMDRKFGRNRKGTRLPPPPSEEMATKSEENVGDAWERYLNNKPGTEVNWRDRGRRNS